MCAVVPANPQCVRVGGSAGESAGLGRENLTKLCFRFRAKDVASRLTEARERRDIQTFTCMRLGRLFRYASRSE